MTRYSCHAVLKESYFMTLQERVAPERFLDRLARSA